MRFKIANTHFDRNKILKLFFISLFVFIMLTPAQADEIELPEVYLKNVPWGASRLEIRKEYKRLISQMPYEKNMDSLAFLQGFGTYKGYKISFVFSFSSMGLYQIEYNVPNFAIPVVADPMLNDLIREYGVPSKNKAMAIPLKTIFKHRRIFDALWHTENVDINYKKMSIEYNDESSTSSLYISFRANDKFLTAKKSDSGIKLAILPIFTVNKDFTSYMFSPKRRFLSGNAFNRYPFENITDLLRGRFKTGFMVPEQSIEAFATMFENNLDLLAIDGGMLEYLLKNKKCPEPMLNNSLKSITINKKHTAFIEFKFRTYNTTLNGIKYKNKSAFRDAVNQFKLGIISKIKKAATSNDIVIAMPFWGNSSNICPDEEQIDMGKLLIDSGANAVLGFNQGRMNGYDIYKNSVILYSQGNIAKKGAPQISPLIFMDISKTDSRITSILELITGGAKNLYQPILINSKEAQKETKNFRDFYKKCKN